MGTYFLESNVTVFHSKAFEMSPAFNSITSLWETYLQETCAKIYYKDAHAKTEYKDACRSTVYNEGKSNLTIQWHGD